MSEPYPLTRELNSKIVRAYTSRTHKAGLPSTFIRALIDEGVFIRVDEEADIDIEGLATI